jgi:hypothetical protein
VPGLRPFLLPLFTELPRARAFSETQRSGDTEKGRGVKAPARVQETSLGLVLSTS